MSMGARPVRAVQVTRSTGERSHRDEALLIAEEPLEIRIAGDPLAVTMRTPGDDRALVLGFLWAEGIISALDDVGAIAHCGRPGDEAFGNTIDVTPGPGARLCVSDERSRRGTLVTSACGVCGRQSIDDLLLRCAPLPSGGVMSAAAVAGAVATLRTRQPLFARTGGCHAASLVSLSGEHLVTFEDVGRHNAVDKLVGSLLLTGQIPARERALVVSGRTSFEIVQKAVCAGIPIVIGVSAPSSLAVELAERTNSTLLGFARAAECVIYAGGERLEAD
jgi:FdhD protein